jgi:threonine dehydratase
MMRVQISVYDIFLARNRMKDFVIRTSLTLSGPLSDETGAKVCLKLENQQRTGSFKPRGAVNKMKSLSGEERDRGVIAASAGNHGLAVAYTAGLTGTSALVVVPKNTPTTKVEGIRRFGAELVFYGNNYDEAEAYATRLAEENGRTFIHAYEDHTPLPGTARLDWRSCWICLKRM